MSCKSCWKKCYTPSGQYGNKEESTQNPGLWVCLLEVTTAELGARSIRGPPIDGLDLLMGPSRR